MTARGDAPVRICEAPPGGFWGAAWLPDGQIVLNIVYGPEAGEFYVVSDGGGKATKLAAGEGQRQSLVAPNIRCSISTAAGNSTLFSRCTWRCRSRSKRCSSAMQTA